MARAARNHAHAHGDVDDHGDDVDDHGEDDRHLLGRRSFLGAMGAGALGVFLPASGLATPRAARAQAVLPMQVLAMHVHASFSEGDASMYASLSEAARTGMDLVYFSDHDWRKQALAYRSVVHFTSLTNETELGAPWVWLSRGDGSVVARSGGIVTTPSSPLDPVAGALRVQVTSTASGTGWQLFDADDTPARMNLRANVVGQRLQLEVRMNQLSADAWLELRLRLSYYPPLGGRPAGQRLLIYRFGALSGDERSGLRGIVWKPIAAGTWNSIELRPLDDIARLWPELPVAGDNATRALTLGAGSRNGATAEGWFDFLRFFRDRAGAESYAVQDQLLAPYRPMFPSVAFRQADEVSYYEEHMHWLASPPSPISYGPISKVSAPPMPASFRTAARQAIHTAGGLVQLNHPFGVGTAAPVASNQATLLRARAIELLGPVGADIDLVEIAYRARGGATMSTHLNLFDVLARNGRFVTATGVTDDHAGLAGAWSTMQNRFATAVWAPSVSDADVRAALLRGQAWCVEVGTWVKGLDVTVEGNPMGSVSVRPDRAQRTVEVTCLDPPPGGRVQVVRGVVDFAGVASPTTNATVAASIQAAELASGPARRTINTSVPCFVRLQVRDASSRIVAFSNPIWLLRAQPPGGIPAARRAPDTP
jgi:hypothetical protein